MPRNQWRTTRGEGGRAIHVRRCITRRDGAQMSGERVARGAPLHMHRCTDVERTQRAPSECTRERGVPGTLLGALTHLIFHRFGIEFNLTHLRVAGGALTHVLVRWVFRRALGAHEAHRRGEHRTWMSRCKIICKVFFGAPIASRAKGGDAAGGHHVKSGAIRFLCGPRWRAQRTTHQSRAPMCKVCVFVLTRK